MSKKNKSKNNAALYDTNLYNQAGIDATKIILSRRLAVDQNCDSRRIKKIMKKNDRQDALTRFVWYNLPKGLKGEDIEKVLYLRGRCAIVKVGDKFICLPFTLKGKEDSGIDYLSRYKYITLVTMGSTESNNKEFEKVFGDKAYQVLYDIEDEPGVDVDKKAVIIYDYSPEYFSNQITPMEQLNDVVLDIESRMFPYAETAVLSKAGVRGIKVTSETEAEDVNALNSSIKYGALNQEMLFGIKASQDLQDFTNGSQADVSQYLELFQSLENFRKATYGISTGGLMQKQSHMLENESKMNQASNISQGNDSLYQRQWACVVFYSLTGYPIWCDIKQTANPEDNETALVTDNKGGSSNDSDTK